MPAELRTLTAKWLALNRTQSNFMLDPYDPFYEHTYVNAILSDAVFAASLLNDDPELHRLCPPRPMIPEKARDLKPMIDELVRIDAIRPSPGPNAYCLGSRTGSGGSRSPKA
jgi:hypothetical protein